MTASSWQTLAASSPASSAIVRTSRVWEKMPRRRGEIALLMAAMIPTYIGYQWDISLRRAEAPAGQAGKGGVVSSAGACR